MVLRKEFLALLALTGSELVFQELAERESYVQMIAYSLARGLFVRFVLLLESLLQWSNPRPVGVYQEQIKFTQAALFLALRYLLEVGIKPLMVLRRMQWFFEYVLRFI